MSQKLALLDLAIVVAYLAGTTLLALWFVRKQRDVRTYFVGDRNVAWWLVLVSIVATETSTVTFLSVPGLAFSEKGNFTFLQLSFGYVVGRVLVAWILLPQYLRGELFSAYQLLRQRFDSAVQRAASGLFLLTRTIADGLRLFLTALLLQQFTGWDIEASILAMGGITLFYTFLGGMQAVIWTDLIQFVIYILGAVLAAAFVVGEMPGGLTDFFQHGAAKFTLLNLSTDLTENYTLWAGVIGGAFFSMASHGADQIMVQRYLCSRSLSGARAALVLSGFVVLAQFTLFLLIGVGLYVLNVQGSLPLDLLPTQSGRVNDEVFGLFIVQRMPAGLVGLVIAAVLAAAMSTLSSSLNSSASATVADFYRPLRPHEGEHHYLRVSRSMTLVWGVAQIGVALGALWLGSADNIINQVLQVAGFTTGMILGLFLLGSMRRPVSSAAALIGLVVGFAAVLSIWLPSTWGHKLLAWPWYAPVGTTVTVAVALLVDRLWSAHGSPSDGGPQPGLDEPR
jgi:SSS family transporter